MAQLENGSVHKLVVDTFTSLGVPNPTVVRRAVIFRERSLVGQRFLCGDVQAVQLAGENQLSFYDNRGRLLLAVDTGVPCPAKAA